MTFVLVFWVLAQFRKAASFPEVAGSRVKSINNNEEFKALVINSLTTNLTVCDFYTTSCPPCKAAVVPFSELASEFPSVDFFKVDVSACKDVGASQNIETVPTFKLHRGGRLLELERSFNKARLKALIEKHTAKGSKVE